MCKDNMFMLALIADFAPPHDFAFAHTQSDDYSIVLLYHYH